MALPPLRKEDYMGLLSHLNRAERYLEQMWPVFAVGQWQNAFGALEAVRMAHQTVEAWVKAGEGE